MPYVDFLREVHNSSKRNYLDRVLRRDKAECATIAKRFDREFFDGDRCYGYGGYHYDGRWRSVAQKLADHYDLRSGDRILDVGCGKGFLLYEFTQVVPGVEIAGLDVSAYAIEHAKAEVQPFLQQGDAVSLPYPDRSFDLVLSINTLHNLYNFDLRRALREMERVSRGHKYVIVDSYRSEREKVNLLYWQLTCECFYTPQEWEWFFEQSGYTGDYAFTFFE
jgi:protein-L-isoaspartate(D-aspartate) O-methyltransferase